MDAEANSKTLHIDTPTDSQPKLEIKNNYPGLNWGEPKPLFPDGALALRGTKTSPCSSPIMASSPGALGIPIPSPIITKRTRTNSTYDRAMENPIEKGVIKYFSRGKGHGFISRENASEDIFVHVSDIEGEYVPRENDEVSFRMCPIPPKSEKFQAIHVRIVNFTPDVHLKWDSPLESEEVEKSETIQTFVVD